MTPTKPDHLRRTFIKKAAIVHIATPPHWHGIMAVDAAKCRKGYLVRETDDKYHWRAANKLINPVMRAPYDI